jgi:hypothetical protein
VTWKTCEYLTLSLGLKGSRPGASNQSYFAMQDAALLQKPGESFRCSRKISHPITDDFPKDRFGLVHETCQNYGMKRHWYRVEMLSGHDTYLYFGSTTLNEASLMKQLGAGGFVLLEDLVYFDDNERIQGWSEWDPHYLARVYLNPTYVISIMPMAEDLRKESSGDNTLLQLPNALRERPEKED